MRELRPRVARPASTAWNLAKTWAQTAAMWLVFLGVLPAAVLAAETAVGGTAWRGDSPALRVLGATLFAVGGAVGIWTGVLFAVAGRGTPLPFDTAPRLVLRGPYRHVRNPMAIASFAQGFGVAAWLGSPAVTLYVVAGMATWQCIARPWEERDLEARFGASYSRYRDAVPCWLPRLRGYVEP